MIVDRGKRADVLTMLDDDSGSIAAPEQQTKAQRLAGIAATLGLLVLAIWMLASFLPALAWATVLAIATWPLFLAARRVVGRTWAAAAVTALIAVALLVALILRGLQGAPRI